MDRLFFHKSHPMMRATEQLILQLPRKLPIRYRRLKRYGEYLKGMGVTIAGTGVTLPESNVKLAGDPQVSLLDSLINLWDDLKESSKVIIVLLDDVQNYEKISGFLTILKNVLSDEEIVDTGFLFVLSCTRDGWLQFQKKHHPIGRYFTPRLKLERLNKERTFEILDRTLKGTGVHFDDKIKEKVYEYTKGHPFELQILCSNLYDNQIGGRVTDMVWDNCD